MEAATTNHPPIPAHLSAGVEQLLEPVHLFALLHRSLLGRTKGEGQRVCVGGEASSFYPSLLLLDTPPQSPAYHQDTQHHVVVVNEEDELLGAGGEFSRHTQDEVLHFGLGGGRGREAGSIRERLIPISRTAPPIIGARLPNIRRCKTPPYAQQPD